jgi:hypothetical protein
MHASDEEPLPERETWSELLHAAGRILSYGMAVDFLLRMRRSSPELFRDYEVRFVPSSLAVSKPLRNIDHGLEFSIERMSAGLTSKDIAIYVKNQEYLEHRDFDGKIQRQSKNINPIVHAEVLLADSLKRDNISEPAQFYYGYRYIGCSKPTCRLCELYFEATDSPIRVRAGHGNLYCNWRLPDVLVQDGKAALAAQERTMNAMLKVLRPEVFKVMQEKISSKKRHDSNTDPTNPMGWGSSAMSRHGTDDGISTSGPVHPGEPFLEAQVSMPGATPPAGANGGGEFGDDDDGEHGGGLLSV